MNQNGKKILIGIDPGIVTCGCAVLKDGLLFTHDMPTNYQPNYDFRAVNFVVEIIQECGGIGNVRTYQEIYIPHKITRDNYQTKQVEMNAMITNRLGNTCRLIKPYEWKQALSGCKRGAKKPSLKVINQHLKERFGLMVQTKKLTRHEIDAMAILCYGYDLDKREGLI